MADTIVTVSTYWSIVEAQMARNQLECAGIKSCLADENASSLMWHVSNPLGSIKLQVMLSDFERAMEILQDFTAEETPVDENRNEDEALATEDFNDQFLLPMPVAANTEEVIDWEAVDVVPVPEELHNLPEIPRVELNSRQMYTDRAFQSAIYSLLFFPLVYWAFWLLIKVYFSDLPLGYEYRVRLFKTLGLMLLIFPVWSFFIFGGFVPNLVDAVPPY